MARRGTKVGEAYIEIHGDNRDWIKSTSKVRQQWLKANQKDADKFEKIWHGAIHNGVEKGMQRLIRSGALQDFDHYVKRWGSLDEAVRRIELGMRDLYSAERKTNAITRDQYLLLSKNFRAWRDARYEEARVAEERLKHAEVMKAYEKWQRDNARDYREGLKDRAKLQARLDREREASLRKTVVLTEQARKANRKWDAALERIAARYKEMEGITGRLSKEQEEFVRRLHRNEMDGIESSSQWFRTRERQLKEIQRRELLHQRVLEGYLRKTDQDREMLHRKQLDRIRAETDAVIEGQQSVGEAVRRMVRRTNREGRRGIFQRLFGEQPGDRNRRFGLLGRLTGSRNDFLNFVGRLFTPLERGAARAGEAVSKLIGLALDPLIRRLMEGGGAAQFIGKGLDAFKIKGGNLIAILIQIGLTMASINFVLGIFAAALSGVGGILTALVASLGAGLVGTLTTLLPILGAVGLGLTGLVVGITGMTDAQKKALKPLQSWYKSLSRMVADELFEDLTDQVSGLLDALGPHLETSLSRAADAISETITGIIDTIQGRDFQNVLDTLDDTIPGIVGNVLDMFGSLAIGVTGVMSAISPQVEKLTGEWAEKLAGWADWAISPEGQESISNWFDDMLDSAQQLWGLLGAVGDVLGALFESDSARETGDSWIESWTDSLRELADFIRSPEGEEAISRWMDQAKELAADLGDVVDGLSDMFTALNSEDAQDNLSTVLDTLSLMAEVVAGISKAWNFFTHMPLPSIGLSLSDITHALGTVTEWFQSGGLGRLWETVKGWFTSGGVGNLWDTITSWFEDNVWTPIREWFANIDWGNLVQDLIQGLIDAMWEQLIPDDVKPIFRRIIDWVKSVFGIASPSTVMFDIGVDIIQGLINGLLSLLGPLGTAAQSVVDTLDRIWQNGEGGFPGVARRAIDALRPMIPGLDWVMDRLGNTGKNGMESMGTKMASAAKKVPNKVSRSLSGLDNAVAGRARDAAQAGLRALGQFPSGAGAVISRTAGIIRAYSKSMYNAGYSVGRSIGTGMVAGIKSQAGSVYATAKAMAASAEKAARAQLISRSPSKAMMMVGQDAVAGFLIPFEDAVGPVRDAATDMVDSMLASLSVDSMFARGKAATEGLLAGLGTASGYQVNVDGMMDATGGVRAPRSGVIIEQVNINSNARDTTNAARQMLDGIAEALVGP